MIPQSTITTIKTMARNLQDIDPKASCSTVQVARAKARKHLQLVSEIETGPKGQKQ